MLQRRFATRKRLLQLGSEMYNGKLVKHGNSSKIAPSYFIKPCFEEALETCDIQLARALFVRVYVVH